MRDDLWTVSRVRLGVDVKDLKHWLHFQILYWRMPGMAVQVDHGKVWHKVRDPSADWDGGWATCGTYLARGNVHAKVGKWQRRQSPWDSKLGRPLPHWQKRLLCTKCFSEELPILNMMEDHDG